MLLVVVLLLLLLLLLLGLLLGLLLVGLGLELSGLLVLLHNLLLWLLWLLLAWLTDFVRFNSRDLELLCVSLDGLWGLACLKDSCAGGCMMRSLCRCWCVALRMPWP